MLGGCQAQTQLLMETKMFYTGFFFSSSSEWLQRDRNFSASCKGSNLSLIIPCLSKLPTNKSEIQNCSCQTGHISASEMAFQWCDLEGCLISMWSFSCQFVFNQTWTMEADNEIPESHPESSSAFGWSFCMSVVLSVLCNLLPESYTGHQEAADASHLNVPLCAVSSVSVWGDPFIAEMRCLQSTNLRPGGGKGEQASFQSEVKEEHPLPLPSHAPGQVSHPCCQYARANPAQALAHRFF